MPLGLNLRQFIIHGRLCESMRNAHRRSAVSLGSAKPGETSQNQPKPSKTCQKLVSELLSRCHVLSITWPFHGLNSNILQVNCTEPHRVLPGALLRSDPYTNIIAVCCKQSLLWNSLSKRKSTTRKFTRIIENQDSGSAFFIGNSNAFSSLIVCPKWPVQLFRMKNVAGLNYFARLVMKATKGSRHFVLNYLWNKDLHQRKLIFLLPSIVIESASLDVVI